MIATSGLMIGTTTTTLAELGADIGEAIIALLTLLFG